MWLVVAGVTIAVIGLFLLKVAQEAPAKKLALENAKRLATQSGKEEPKESSPMCLGRISCFWIVWLIIGSVWIFSFTPETTFQAAGGGNATDAHSTECAFLASFSFIFIICLWTVPCVLNCVVVMLAQQVSACLNIENAT
jgi:hypothetical protein